MTPHTLVLIDSISNKGYKCKQDEMCRGWYNDNYIHETCPFPYYTDYGTILRDKSTVIWTNNINTRPKQSDIEKYHIQKDCIQRCTNDFLFCVSQHEYPRLGGLVRMSLTRVDYYMVGQQADNDMIDKFVQNNMDVMEMTILILRQEIINSNEDIIVIPNYDNLRITIVRPLIVDEFANILISKTIDPIMIRPNNRVRYLLSDRLVTEDDNDSCR